MSDAISSINGFRKAVQKCFEDGLKIKFVPGKLEGPNQSGAWLGSCYLQRVQEDPGRPAEQQVFITLRVYAPFNGDALISPHRPYDPTPLEEMAEKVLMVIAANQTGLGAWYQRVIQIMLDPDTQGIQASIMAYSANPGVTP